MSRSPGPLQRPPWPARLQYGWCTRAVRSVLSGKDLGGPVAATRSLSWPSPWLPPTRQFVCHCCPVLWPRTTLHRWLTPTACLTGLWPRLNSRADSGPADLAGASHLVTSLRLCGKLRENTRFYLSRRCHGDAPGKTDLAGLGAAGTALLGLPGVS